MQKNTTMEAGLDFDDSEQILNYIVEKGELPRYLYKYTSIESLMLILKNSTLKFSKPSEFNDPFDCNITIDTDNTEEEIEGYIKLLQQNNKLTADQIAELRQQFYNPQELYAITNKSIKDAKENFGVTCFSEIDNNLLMWAHYSDKHKGVCLKFDILADTDFFMTPFPVLYKEEYPKYNYIRNRDGLAKFLLETKSIDWEYEKEIRVMKRGPDFYAFNKKSLVEVIIGARTTDSERSSIIQLIKENDYEYVTLRICNISKTKFELEINKL